MACANETWMKWSAAFPAATDTTKTRLSCRTLRSAFSESGRMGSAPRSLNHTVLSAKHESMWHRVRIAGY